MTDVTTADLRTVAAQLGREPLARWRVGHRCSWDRPTVIVNGPRALDGDPFPTLYWLTCPHLVRAVSANESAGGAGSWADRISEDAHLRFEVLAADQQYRAAREIEGGGDDPCAGVGVAGQKDPRATKCLHAHVASYLAGIPDPIGRGTLDGVETECENDECAALLARTQVAAGSGRSAGE